MATRVQKMAKAIQMMHIILRLIKNHTENDENNTEHCESHTYDDII